MSASGILTGQKRRAQSERNAQTRDKLINAAINCLYRFGYGATTVSMISEEAGVSRGGMTHQFPAKTDLMIAVVRAVFESDAEHYISSAKAMEPMEWMLALPSVLWDVISRPSAIASMEIMLAARSDPELAEKLRIMQGKIDIQAHAWILDRHRDAGLRSRPDEDAIHRVLVAAARGLALEAVFMKNRKQVEKSIAVLGEILQHLYPKLAEHKRAALSAMPKRGGLKR